MPPSLPQRGELGCQLLHGHFDGARLWASPGSCDSLEMRVHEAIDLGDGGRVLLRGRAYTDRCSRFGSGEAGT
jgi:hypothetical protein